MPLPQEGYIMSSPFVAGCVMFGRAREQPGLLVEPSPKYTFDAASEAALVDFRNKIWCVHAHALR